MLNVHVVNVADEYHKLVLFLENKTIPTAEYCETANDTKRQL